MSVERADGGPKVDRHAITSAVLRRPSAQAPLFKRICQTGLAPRFGSLPEAFADEYAPRSRSIAARPIESARRYFEFSGDEDGVELFADGTAVSGCWVTVLGLDGLTVGVGGGAVLGSGPEVGGVCAGAAEGAAPPGLWA
jgi:hypothetical protein